MIVIKRIGLNSAFKIGAIVGMITAAIFGLFFVGLQGLATSAILGLASLSSNTPSSFSQSGAGDAFAAFSMATLCIFYVIYVVMAAIGGGIGGLVWGFAYNLAARWVGGLELELDQDSGKSKRSYDFDDIYE
jgi:hypothetical protein